MDVQRHALPSALAVPAVQALQTNDAPEPVVPKPALHVHVAAPAALLLLLGHAVQEVAPLALNVLAPHSTVQGRT